MITIQIETSNAAFIDEGVQTETARILRQLADKLTTQSCEGLILLRDLNGNTVGNYYNDEGK